MITNEIPSCFTRYSDTFHLKSWDKPFAIYHRLRRGRHLTYEVHKVRPFTKTQRKFLMSEYNYRLASTADFGTYGWEFNTFAQALRKIENLRRGSE